MFRLFNRYWLIEWMRAFIIISILIFLALLPMKSVEMLGDNAISAMSLSLMLRLSFYALPATLVLVLPVSGLLAIGAAWSRFRRDNEIVVLQSTGQSKFRAIIPALAISFTLATGNLALQHYFSPEGLRQFSSINPTEIAGILDAKLGMQGLATFGDSMAVRVGTKDQNEEWTDPAILLKSGEGFAGIRADRMAYDFQNPRQNLIFNNGEFLTSSGKSGKLKFKKLELALTEILASRQEKEFDSASFVSRNSFQISDYIANCAEENDLCRSANAELAQRSASSLAMPFLAIIILSWRNRNWFGRLPIVVVACSSVLLGFGLVERIFLTCSQKGFIPSQSGPWLALLLVVVVSIIIFQKEA